MYSVQREKLRGPGRKNVLGAHDVIFFQATENTTKRKQCSKALRKNDNEIEKLLILSTVCCIILKAFAQVWGGGS